MKSRVDYRRDWKEWKGMKIMEERKQNKKMKSEEWKISCYLDKD